MAGADFVVCCGAQPFQWMLEHHITHVIGACASYIGTSALFLKLNFLCVYRLQEEEEAMVKLCLQNLSLRSLSKDPSVNSSQMILCCKRLVEQRFPLMQGLHICVSHFFSVMQDGDLCIPWDWKKWARRTLSQTGRFFLRIVFYSNVCFSSKTQNWSHN